MKKTFKGAALLLAAVMIGVMVAGCGGQGQPADQGSSQGTPKGSSSQSDAPSGGTDTTAFNGIWTYTDQTGMQEDAQAAFDKAFETYTASSVFSPIALLGTQVVAGTNYAILMSETPSENPEAGELKVVTIYQDLQGNCTINGFVKLDLGEQYTKAVDKADYTAPEAGEPLLGGWQTHLGGPELPKEAAEFFSVYEALADQQMMVYLGSATAEDETVYAALKTDTADSESGTAPLELRFVSVKDGTAVAEKIAPLNISDYSSYGAAED